MLGARSPSSVAANTAAPRRLRSVSSLNKVATSSPHVGDRTSPSQVRSDLAKLESHIVLNSPVSQKLVPSRAPTKPRASEPLISVRAPSVRSPIVTRRRSNTALQAHKLSVSPVSCPCYPSHTYISTDFPLILNSNPRSLQPEQLQPVHRAHSLHLAEPDL